jgi:hypothetical protein
MDTSKSSGMDTAMDMGTAGPVIRGVGTSRGGGRPSASSGRPSVVGLSGVGVVGAAVGGGRGVVTYALRSWRC